MKLSVVIGVLLIALGTAALVYKQFSYSSEETVFQLGSLKATAQMEKTIDIPDVLSIGLIVVGVGFLLFGRKG